MRYLRRDRVGKRILRKVLYRYILRESMDRLKTVLSIPIQECFLEPELCEWGETLLNWDTIHQQ